MSEETKPTPMTIERAREMFKEAELSSWSSDDDGLVCTWNYAAGFIKGWESVNQSEHVKILKTAKRISRRLPPGDGGETMSEETIVIFSNYLFGFNFGSDEFRTSWKFETCRHCTQLESGKWAVVINYDC